MSFLILNFLSELPSMIPFSEYLEVPWNWFLELGTITRVVVVVFGALGFYIILRIFYKIVEGILSLFQ